jgi:hypothetical protein
VGWFWWWAGLCIGLRWPVLVGLLVGYCGQVSPGEPPLHFFFWFIFLSYFLFLNSVLIQN